MNRSCAVVALIVGWLAFAPFAVADTFSKAARYLMNEQIANACEGPGAFFEDQVITTDLTGDGRGDLVLDHGLIECRPPSISRRSLFCGIRACSVLIYVREAALLVQKAETLSIGAELVPGTPPGVKLLSHDFTEGVMRWTGRDFQME